MGKQINAQMKTYAPPIRVFVSPAKSAKENAYYHVKIKHDKLKENFAVLMDKEGKIISTYPENARESFIQQGTEAVTKFIQQAVAQLEKPKELSENNNENIQTESQQPNTVETVKEEELTTLHG